jgi:hypothetical protein
MERQVHLHLQGKLASCADLWASGQHQTAWMRECLGSIVRSTLFCDPNMMLCGFGEATQPLVEEG